MAHPLNKVSTHSLEQLIAPQIEGLSHTTSSAQRRGSQEGEDESNGYVLDDFTASPYASPQIRAAGGAVALPPKKPKSFMNFTPTLDELEVSDSANVRLRRVKRGDKMLTTQGGDG